LCGNDLQRLENPLKLGDRRFSDTITVRSATVQHLNDLRSENRSLINSGDVLASARLGGGGRKERGCLRKRAQDEGIDGPSRFAKEENFFGSPPKDWMLS